MSSRFSDPAQDGDALARAEHQLRSLELFGMRFGLDRMRRMMTALSSPQQHFDSLQVLGTNGKSSTTRMIAAIIEGHGLRTGTYLSPHLVSYRERVLVAGEQIGARDFAEAVARAVRAAERVNRTLAEGDHVTQFELLTAAALWHMAQQEVQVAVIEAGLGGRYDATSVVEPLVSVLTNVGLEHTRWLGPTVRHIAEEKLAAVRDGATLVLGEQLAPDALEVAQRVAAERGAHIVRARSLPHDLELRANGAFQRRNFALARAAAESYLRLRGIELDEHAVRNAATSVEVRGRLQRLSEDPLTIIDGAHNPHAVRALVQTLPAAIGGWVDAAHPAAADNPADAAHRATADNPGDGAGLAAADSPAGAAERPLALVMGVLEDKDAASMLAALLPLSTRAWFTAPLSSRALSPAALQSLARQQRFEDSICEPDPTRALADAQAWARQHGGVVLVTGSVYLVGAVLAQRDGAARGPQAAILQKGSLP